MGRGLRASLLGTLAVTTLRNARRTGLASPTGSGKLTAQRWRAERPATAPRTEAVRHVIRTTRDYQQDELRDDVTVLCLDWRGSADG